MFEDDDSIWWVTGGAYAGPNSKSTEVFDNDTFSKGPELPKIMSRHNLINVNNTHMVTLGGNRVSDEAFIFDR